MIDPGLRAPDFDLPDHAGTRQTLPGLLRDGPLILYFYPADFTPVCTAQACFFRDAASELASAGLRVVGISGQDGASHTRFREVHRLGFTLLADASLTVTKAYGALGLFGVLPFGLRRVTYLITPDGLVKDRIASDLRLAKHTEFVKRAISTFAAARPR